MMVINTKLCEYTKNFKWVNYVVYEFYLKKALTKK